MTTPGFTLGGERASPDDSLEGSLAETDTYVFAYFDQMEDHCDIYEILIEVRDLWNTPDEYTRTWDPDAPRRGLAIRLEGSSKTFQQLTKRAGCASDERPDSYHILKSWPIRLEGGMFSAFDMVGRYAESDHYGLSSALVSPMGGELAGADPWQVEVALPEGWTDDEVATFLADEALAVSGEGLSDDSVRVEATDGRFATEVLFALLGPGGDAVVDWARHVDQSWGDTGS